MRLGPQRIMEKVPKWAGHLLAESSIPSLDNLCHVSKIVFSPHFVARGIFLPFRIISFSTFVISSLSPRPKLFKGASGFMIYLNTLSRLHCCKLSWTDFCKTLLTCQTYRRNLKEKRGGMKVQDIFRWGAWCVTRKSSLQAMKIPIFQFPSFSFATTKYCN